MIQMPEPLALSVFSDPRIPDLDFAVEWFGEELCPLDLASE